MAADDSYPDSWKPRGAPAQQPESPSVALALAIESYIAALDENALRQLLDRARGGR